MQPDQAIIDFVTAGLEAKQTHYVDVPGMLPLREALTKHLQGQGYESVQMANVLVTAGLQEARLPRVPDPGSTTRPRGVARRRPSGRAENARHSPPHHHGPRSSVDPVTGYLPTLDGIQNALQNGAKVLFLESPVRLTGTAFDKEAVAQIARLANQYGAAVIWYQGLAPWVNAYVSIWNEPGMDRLAVLLGEAFPGVGIESWYIGYIAANTDWWEKGPTATNRPSRSAQPRRTNSGPSRLPKSMLRSIRTSSTISLACATTPLNQLKAKAVPGQAVSVLAVELPQPIMAAALRKNGFGFADRRGLWARGRVIRLAVTPNNAIADALTLLK